MTELHGELAARLADARARTMLLIAPVSEEDLRRQHDPLMGPILWDLGHIAHFEELWLLDNLRGEIRFGEMPGMFNPFEHPRAVRGTLELPSLGSMTDTLAAVRARVYAALEQARLDDADAPLTHGGYAYNMVLQHEYQHGETILQTMQLKQGAPYAAPRAAPVRPPTVHLARDPMAYFPGGDVPIGTADRTTAYDNERPQHIVNLKPFLIDVAPVTRAEYLRFMEDGGYTRRELWTDAGWRWLEDARVSAPKYWSHEAGEWTVRTLDRTTAAEADVPVCHVCCYEAEAYARWADKRLPTEQEWEAAASWDPATCTRRAYPWGNEAPSPLHANVDQLSFEPAPIGSHVRNMSPIGCYGMIGDVWEWTSSTFSGYPGFTPFPYAEYSQVFFGPEYRVLRGGSWATRAGAIRNSFRNWDYPIRRQIFSGFRCARDV